LSYNNHPAASTVLSAAKDLGNSKLAINAEQMPYVLAAQGLGMTQAGDEVEASLGGENVVFQPVCLIFIDIRA